MRGEVTMGMLHVEMETHPVVGSVVAEEEVDEVLGAAVQVQGHHQPVCWFGVGTHCWVSDMHLNQIEAGRQIDKGTFRSTQGTHRAALMPTT